ncbi:MAG: hypothetical protein ACRD4X_10280 [Candidatus Acidiferrales bacterium]
MNRSRVVSSVILVFALGFLMIPAQQAMAAAREKTVTLEVQGMV